MPTVRIKVVHHIEQVVMLDIPTHELEKMSYEDAIVNVPFDELQPSTYDTEIIDVTVDGEEYYF